MSLVKLLLRGLVAFAALVSLTSGEQYDSDLAERMVQWSGAAYCCGTLGSGCSDWSCPSCQGDLDTTVIYDKSTNANGFVGYSAADDFIVVSFSGTDPLSIKNWIDDIKTLKEPFTGYGAGPVDGCGGCKVHKGFYETYLSVAVQVRSAVAVYRASHPSALVLVTGHSLGAALAQHAAIDVATGLAVPVTHLYNFGQPRTGNVEFTNFSSAVLGGAGAGGVTYRVTHHKDPVPHLPFESWGFHHEPTEVYYNKANTEFVACDGGGEDPSCADQWAVALDVADHLSYLNFDFTANYLACKL